VSARRCAGQWRSTRARAFPSALPRIELGPLTAHGHEHQQGKREMVASESMLMQLRPADCIEARCEGPEPGAAAMAMPSSSVVSTFE